jgi:hypothetical protein
MNDPLDQDLRARYAALQTPPTADLDARILGAVRARSAAPPPTGRRLALLASGLVVAAAVGWAVRSTAPKHEQTSSAPQQEPRPEEIAARVNGEVILWKQIQDRLSAIKPSDVTDELRKSVRRELAEAVMIRQFAARKKVTVTEAEVEEAIQSHVKLYGSAAELEKVVRIRSRTMTQYRQEQRELILMFKTYRYVAESQYIDPELKSLVLQSYEIPERNLRKYFDANPQQFQAMEKVTFMRLGLKIAGQEESKRALFESLLRKIDRGGEFSMMVFFYSDIRRAKDFRDMGVSRKDLDGVYTPETIRFLFDELKEGEISPIVQDGDTLNLFKMEQKINQKAESFEEAQNKIRIFLENQIHGNNRKKMLDWLKAQAKCEPADLFGEK